MAKLAVHPLALAFNIFGLLVWVIALGGTAGATYSCQTTNSYEYCAKTYQVGDDMPYKLACSAWSHWHYSASSASCSQLSCQ
jgi:hypothetical protein